MKMALYVLSCALLGACAASSPFPDPPTLLFRDESFSAPAERYQASDLFELSEPMHHFVRNDIAMQLHSEGAASGLIEALYARNQLKLAYDPTTRTASEAFAARAGNCLSLVILTAAFAKELHLGVEYNAVGHEEVWSRSGEFLLGSGHVNVSVGTRESDVGSRVVTRPLTVDFLPPEDIPGLPSREIPERMIVAMYMNNKAVEALVRGELDDAYGWAREAIRRSPHFANSYNTLGVVYLHHGDAAQAARVFAYALEREPDNTALMSNLADVAARLGDAQQAAGLRSRLAQIDPNPPYYFFNLGMAAIRNQDFPAAKKLFAKEVARADYNDEFHYWLGVAYFKLGEIDRARRELAVAMEKSSRRSEHDLYAAKLAWLRTLSPGSGDMRSVATPAR